MDFRAFSVVMSPGQWTVRLLQLRGFLLLRSHADGIFQWGGGGAKIFYLPVTFKNHLQGLPDCPGCCRGYSAYTMPNMLKNCGKKFI